MTWIIPDYVIWQNVPGDLALLDAREGTYHALNESAAHIWRAAADGLSADAIAARVATAHGVAAEAVAADVAAFLADAQARGLIAVRAELA